MGQGGYGGPLSPSLAQNSYVSSGLKIVKGASRAKLLRTVSRGASMGVDGNGTVWSGGTVPLGGGPELSGSVSRKQGVAWEGRSDFVLAYRLRKVKVSRKAGTVKREEDYIAGAMLGHDVLERGTGRDELDIATEDLDWRQEGEGLVFEEVMDGKDLVVCVVPVHS